MGQTILQYLPSIFLFGIIGLIILFVIRISKK